MQAGKPKGEHDFKWVMEANTLHPSMAASVPDSEDERPPPRTALAGNLLLILLVLTVVVLTLQFCAVPVAAS